MRLSNGSKRISDPIVVDFTMFLLNKWIGIVVMGWQKNWSLATVQTSALLMRPWQ